MVWIDSGHLLPLIADGRIFNLSHNLWHTGVSCRCLGWTTAADDGQNDMSPWTPRSTGPAISYACTVPSCLLKEQSAPSQHDLLRSGKAGCGSTESRLFVTAVCSLRSSGREAVAGVPPPRASERAVRSSGYGSPELRLALGTGSTHADFSGDTCDPITECADHVQQCCRDARYFRDAAGWIAVPSTGSKPTDSDRLAGVQGVASRCR
jgi:hypothetical protein